MTSTEPRRARLWLTPTVAVFTVALYAVFALAAGQHLRRELAGAPATPTEPPAATSSPKPTYTIAGNVRLQPGQYVRQGQSCRSNAEDLVVVTDKTGASLTYTELRTGALTDTTCELPFTLQVPTGEGSYGMDVPHWGAVTYTEAELADMLELTFG